MSRISLRSRTSRLAALAVTGAMVFGGATITAPAAEASTLYKCTRPAGTAPLLVKWSSQTEWVKYAQCQLNNAMVDADPLSSARVNLKVDGIFGDGTYASVKKFQGCMHITVDGKIGSNTWTALSYWNSRAGFVC